MPEFISRRQLEVRHSRSYEMKEKLKELGCEWDGIARAWIAPSIEVKELCFEILDQSEDIIYRARPGNHLDESIGNQSFEECMGMADTPEKSLSNPIAYIPARQDAINICGEENTRRYWRDEIATEAAEILASGDNNWNAIYERLEDAGWKSRNVSLLKDLVEHFRAHPPMPAIDTKEDIESLAVVFHKPHEVDGAISVLCSKDGTPTAFKVEFPYDEKKVRITKSWVGRKWHGDKKYWEVPIIHARSLFGNFKYFQRSPKAAEIEKSLEVQ
jgi:hypothetical protein